MIRFMTLSVAFVISLTGCYAMWDRFENTTTRVIAFVLWGVLVGVAVGRAARV